MKVINLNEWKKKKERERFQILASEAGILDDSLPAAYANWLLDQVDPPFANNIGYFKIPINKDKDKND